jgi:hypothetical protein
MQPATTACRVLKWSGQRNNLRKTLPLIHSCPTVQVWSIKQMELLRSYPDIFRLMRHSNYKLIPNAEIVILSGPDSWSVRLFMVKESLKIRGFQLGLSVIFPTMTFLCISTVFHFCAEIGSCLITGTSLTASRPTLRRVICDTLHMIIFLLSDASLRVFCVGEWTGNLVSPWGLLASTVVPPTPKFALGLGLGNCGFFSRKDWCTTEPHFANRGTVWLLTWVAVGWCWGLRTQTLTRRHDAAALDYPRWAGLSSTLSCPESWGIQAHRRHWTACLQSKAVI